MANSNKESAKEDLKKKFQHMTAEKFAVAWNKYDADGNGFIEGVELDSFFKNLVMENTGSCDEAGMSEVMLKETIAQYMDAYDEDGDGKIGMSELADILKPEENFALILKTQQDVRRTREEFDQIWQKYDNDGNGYIDSGELKNFLQDLLHDKNITEAKMGIYTSALLKMLDKNNDRKLEKVEMTKFLSIKE